MHSTKPILIFAAGVLAIATMPTNCHALPLRFPLSKCAMAMETKLGLVEPMDQLQSYSQFNLDDSITTSNTRDISVNVLLSQLARKHRELLDFYWKTAIRSSSLSSQMIPRRTYRLKRRNASLSSLIDLNSLNGLNGLSLLHSKHSQKRRGEYDSFDKNNPIASVLPENNASRDSENSENTNGIITITNEDFSLQDKEKNSDTASAYSTEVDRTPLGSSPISIDKAIKKQKAASNVDASSTTATTTLAPENSDASRDDIEAKQATYSMNSDSTTWTITKVQDTDILANEQNGYHANNNIQQLRQSTQKPIVNTPANTGQPIASSVSASVKTSDETREKPQSLTRSHHTTTPTHPMDTHSASASNDNKEQQQQSSPSTLQSAPAAYQIDNHQGDALTHSNDATRNVASAHSDRASNHLPATPEFIPDGKARSTHMPLMSHQRSPSTSAENPPSNPISSSYAAEGNNAQQTSFPGIQIEPNGNEGLTKPTSLEQAFEDETSAY
ncbi:hypothetical protein BDF22DRAFT_694148 [Syncephalis plumigaleata]|nr:hypothetical protein BDF22DRAFT_694148 [Syncephalis plumigaleata]